MARKTIDKLLSDNQLKILRWMIDNRICKTYSADVFDIFNRLINIYVKHKSIANSDAYIPTCGSDRMRTKAKELYQFCTTRLHCGRESTGKCDRIIGWNHKFVEIANEVLRAKFQQPLTSYLFEAQLPCVSANELRKHNNTDLYIFMQTSIPQYVLPGKNLENYVIGKDGRTHTSEEKSTFNWIGIRKEIRKLVFNGCYEVDMKFAYGQIAERDFGIKMDFTDKDFEGISYFDKNLGKTRKVSKDDDYHAKIVRSCLFVNIDDRFKCNDKLHEINKQIVKKRPHKYYYGHRETEIIQQCANPETLLLIRDCFITTNPEFNHNGWIFNEPKQMGKTNETKD